MSTYTGTPLEFPTPLKSMVLPSDKVQPHAGASGNGVQVPSYPGTNEHRNIRTIIIVNFIAIIEVGND